MYDNQFARTRTARRSVLATAASALLAVGAFATIAAAQAYQDDSVIRKISGLSDKMELTTNTSRILTLEKNIPRVQVNDPTLLAVTPLSATQVQISAKKAGVTQVNLWDEDGTIHTVDVMIYGDARELSNALQTQFPHSSIRVYRYSESLVLSGFVDRPDHVGPIMRLAEDYAPKVINNINVGGVQQILLKVKVMEVSRTKLRQLGVDWAYTSGGGGFALNSIGEMLTRNAAGNIVTNNNDTFSFGIVDGNNSFFGFLQALQENRVAKILAEPNLVAVSGRPAQFNVGGEFPVLIPQSLGTSSIEFKPYGTQVDFLPIVLGNGNIRLEVRPRVSEIDPSRSVTLNGFDIPALTVRQIDTAVEMKAGQTFALAGLVQERTETLKAGLPYVSDVPIVGVPFRKTEDTVNEIELLIMVTPEFVDPIDCGDCLPEGPGSYTVSPDNCGLYCAGHMEVPTYCNPNRGLGACGGDDCGTCNNGSSGGCSTCGPAGNASGMVMSNGAVLPGGSGYDDAPGTMPSEMPTISDQSQPSDATTPIEPNQSTTPEDLTLPAGPVPGAPATTPPAATEPAGPMPTPPATNGASYPYYQPTYSSTTVPPRGSATYNSAPRPYSPPRQPVYVRIASNPNNPQPQATTRQGQNSLIGPVGYDVE